MEVADALHSGGIYRPGPRRCFSSHGGSEAAQEAVVLREVHPAVRDLHAEAESERQLCAAAAPSPPAGASPQWWGFGFIDLNLRR